MPSLKIKVVGQLIEDTRPTTLLVTESIFKVHQTVKEYLTVFPEMIITAEWGYFRYPISRTKALAISRIFEALNSPMEKLFINLSKIKK